MKRMRILVLITALLFLMGCGKSSISPDLLRAGFIDEVVSFHPGTAGCSLGQALAAANVLRFSSEQNLHLADCRSSFEKAWNETDAETQEYFRENFDGLSGLITTAFSDYDSVRGVFDDAGASEIMSAAMKAENIAKDWESLRSAVKDVLSKS